MSKQKLCATLLCAAMLLAACGGEPQNPAQSTDAPAGEIVGLAEGETIPRFTWLNQVYEQPDANRADANYVFEADRFNPEDIMTLTYSTNTVFKGSEDLAAAVLEAGKNPGLGVRSLHERGITGAGVNVAIIDQNLILNHPEYADRVAAYHDTGTGVGQNEGSMHAPAVLSLLAGETCGVAPGAGVWFAAAPSWELDAQYYADALWWIIEESGRLPEGEKIRVVSISAAPQGANNRFANGDKYLEAVAAAKAAGIMVIDCRNTDPETGFVFLANYDPASPEDVTACAPGYPKGAWDGEADDWDYSTAQWDGYIYAPASYRTRAEMYASDKPQYSYDGAGGQSWSVPYVAGVLALGWQVRPELDYATMKQLLFDSACMDSGVPVVDPVAFVAAVESYQE